MAYDALVPDEGRQADYRMAMVCALMINIAQSIYKKKDSAPKVVRPDDLLPPWHDIAEDLDAIASGQSVEEMKQILLSLKKSVDKKPPMRTKPPKRPVQ